MFPFIPEVKYHDDRNADIGCDGTVPVDLTAGEGTVVLSEDDDDAEDQCKEYAKGEAGGAVDEFLRVLALRLEGPAEAIVADGDAEPYHEAGHAGEVQQPGIGCALTDEGV